MSGPLVSVCIGAYNRKDYIRECVDSALGQTWTNREVIVVDDASTDGTREILESYGRDIRLILRDKNSGICPVTRNQAAQAARGGYVAFLDSDDKWYPQKLAKQVEFPDVPTDDEPRSKDISVLVFSLDSSADPCGSTKITIRYIPENLAGKSLLIFSTLFNEQSVVWSRKRREKLGRANPAAGG
jgi:glycosyltransferase involved in cell wall biosynthesis